MASIIQDWVSELSADEQIKLLTLHGQVAPLGMQDADAPIRRWARRCMFYVDDKRTVLNQPFDDRTDMMFGSVEEMETVLSNAYSDSYRYALLKSAMPPSREDNDVLVKKKLLLEWAIFMKTPSIAFLMGLERSSVQYAKSMIAGIYVLAEKHPNAVTKAWWKQLYDACIGAIQVTINTTPTPTTEASENEHF